MTRRSNAVADEELVALPSEGSDEEEEYEDSEEDSAAQEDDKDESESESEDEDQATKEEITSSGKRKPKSLDGPVNTKKVKSINGNPEESSEQSKKKNISREDSGASDDEGSS